MASRWLELSSVGAMISLGFLFRADPLRAGPVCVPLVDHVEYTQSIQQGDDIGDVRHEYHAENPYALPSVPLIAGKAVTARMYLRLSDGCPQLGITEIPGLDVVDAGWVSEWGGMPNAFGKSDNGPITVRQGPTDPVWDRYDPRSTAILNVTRMICPCGGGQPHVFFAELTHGGERYGPPLYWYHQHIPVSRMPIPKIVGVPVKYRGKEPSFEEYASLQAASLATPHWALWPLPDSLYGGGYRFYKDHLVIQDLSIKRNDHQLVHNLFTTLCRWTEASGTPDSIFAWLPAKTWDLDYGGYGDDKTHVAYSKIGGSNQVNFAHEMGHLYKGPGTSTSTAFSTWGGIQPQSFGMRPLCPRLG